MKGFLFFLVTTVAASCGHYDALPPGDGTPIDQGLSDETCAV